jgi:hypothetical protein
MFTYLKHGLALAALSMSLTGHAAKLTIECENSLIGCGLAFTSIPVTPDLTPTSTVTSAPYEITNTGSSSVTLNAVSLVIQGDDTVGAGAVSIDPSSTCAASTVLAANDTCDIVLSFQPSTAGLLDWNLVVTPQSSQRALSVNLTTTVAPYFAYVVNSTGAGGYPGSVSLCSVNNDFTFGDGAGTPCSANDLNQPPPPTPPGYYFGPSTIVLNPTGTYAYIANTQGGSPQGINIRICPVNPDKTIVNASCVDATQTFSNPSGMAFNEAGTILYVTTVAGASGPGNNKIFKCPVNLADGDLLDPCTSIAEIYNAAAIVLDDDFSHAYVAAANKVGIYAIDGSGDFTLLQNFTNVNFSYTVGIGLNPSNSILYFNDYNTNSVLSCALSAGLPTQCNVSNGNGLIDAPAGLFITGAHAYISNLAYGNINSVVSCGLNSNGSLNDASCLKLTDPTFSNTRGVLLTP